MHVSRSGIPPVVIIPILPPAPLTLHPSAVGNSRCGERRRSPSAGATARGAGRRSHRRPWLMTWRGCAIAIPWSAPAHPFANVPTSARANRRKGVTRAVRNHVKRMTTRPIGDLTSASESGALTLVNLHSPSSIPPSTHSSATSLPFVTPPCRLSGVASHLDGSINQTTPGKPNHLVIGGVGVTADLGANTNDVTPTPPAFGTFGPVGEAGVDAHAKPAAENRSGAPTLTPGTQPLALVARGSTTRFTRISCNSSSPHGFPPAGYPFVSSAGGAPPPPPQPPVASCPHPVWDDAHAEAGKQCGHAVSRVGSLLTQCVTVRGGEPPTEVTAVGARWRLHTSAALVGLSGVASRVGEVIAAQVRMSALAIGLRHTAMVRHETASCAASRAIGSATLMLPLGRGGQRAGEDTKAKVAEAAQWTR